MYAFYIKDIVENANPVYTEEHVEDYISFPKLNLDFPLIINKDHVKSLETEVKVEIHEKAKKMR